MEVSEHCVRLPSMSLICSSGTPAQKRAVAPPARRECEDTSAAENPSDSPKIVAMVLRWRVMWCDVT
jgi:hypothetical protein